MTKLHGLERHSPSSCNLFAADIAMYVLERVLHMRAPVGCAALRGTAAEAGVARGLADPSLDVAACVDVALAEFDMLATFSGDPNKDKERAAIPGIVGTGLAELRRYGIPSDYQKQVLHHFDGLELPLLGFLDFRFPCGVVIDLKTQLRLSSEIKPGHARQVALYIHDTADEGRVAYVTDKKLAVYRLDDPAAALASLVNIARRIERFLSISDDPHELAGLVAPNYESFFWSNPQARANGREAFGF